AGRTRGGGVQDPHMTPGSASAAASSPKQGLGGVWVGVAGEAPLFVGGEGRGGPSPPRHRKVRAASVRRSSVRVISPFSRRSRRVRAPNLVEASHVAVWRSRSPPADSLTLGSPMYGEPPNLR